MAVENPLTPTLALMAMTHCSAGRPHVVYALLSLMASARSVRARVCVVCVLCVCVCVCGVASPLSTERQREFCGGIHSAKHAHLNLNTAGWADGPTYRRTSGGKVVGINGTGSGTGRERPCLVWRARTGLGDGTWAAVFGVGSAQCRVGDGARRGPTATY